MNVYFDAQLQDEVFDAGTPGWIVKTVVPDENYALHLEFTDGKRGIYDAKPLLRKKIYEPLKNLSFFMKAHIEGDTVVWNEDVDIAPEHLYEYCIVL